MPKMISPNRFGLEFWENFLEPKSIVKLQIDLGPDRHSKLIVDFATDLEPKSIMKPPIGLEGIFRGKNSQNFRRNFEI